MSTLKRTVEGIVMAARVPFVSGRVATVMVVSVVSQSTVAMSMEVLSRRQRHRDTDDKDGKLRT